MATDLSNPPVFTLKILQWEKNKLTPGAEVLSAYMYCSPLDISPKSTKI